MGTHKITTTISTNNNLDYLKLAIKSIRQNAYYKDMPIIVHAENCNDGTFNWLDSNYRKYDLEYYVDTNNDPKGIGGGMDDQVLGMIGSQQPVAVSPGEYIIPADVVSGLGDGSSDAGAKELDGLLDRVRKERTNTTKQPKELNKGKVLPK